MEEYTAKFHFNDKNSTIYSLINYWINSWHNEKEMETTKLRQFIYVGFLITAIFQDNAEKRYYSAALQKIITHSWIPFIIA